jgi:ATP-dependent Clp protease, protease subunit
VAEKEQPVCEEQKKLFLAQAEKELALAAKASNEAREAGYTADIKRIKLSDDQRAEDAYLASDSNHHVFRFTAEVNEMSVALCISSLTRWARKSPECTLTVIFCSPGGSITDGFALYDFLKDLQRSGHTVITKTHGMAASMAGVLLQAGTERVMGRESWLLIHEASFVAFGKVGSVVDTVEWVKKQCDRIADIFAERAAKATDGNQKKVRTMIEKNWTRKDWWIDAPEALKLGFCDKVE